VRKCTLYAFILWRRTINYTGIPTYHAFILTLYLVVNRTAAREKKCILSIFTTTCCISDGVIKLFLMRSWYIFTAVYDRVKFYEMAFFINNKTVKKKPQENRVGKRFRAIWWYVIYLRDDFRIVRYYGSVKKYFAPILRVRFDRNHKRKHFWPSDFRSPRSPVFVSLLLSLSTPLSFFLFERCYGRIFIRCCRFERDALSRIFRHTVHNWKRRKRITRLKKKK